MRSPYHRAMAAFTGIGILCLPSFSWARLPSKIDMSYDAQEKNLHLEIEHVTKNPRAHFIRNIVIYKNDVEIKKSLHVQQTSHAMLVEDAALEAASGDVIRVKARCNEAGYKEETFVIP